MILLPQRFLFSWLRGQSAFSLISPETVVQRLSYTETNMDMGTEMDTTYIYIFKKDMGHT